MKDGKPHGEGEMTYSNGDTYKGSFVNGKRSGTGILSQAQTKYVFEGEWKNDDLPHGTKTYKNGQKYVGDLVEMFEVGGLYLDYDSDEDDEHNTTTASKQSLQRMRILVKFDSSSTAYFATNHQT